MAARRNEPDYIDRTIETVRNHRHADNCWPQWANIFADDIEDLRSEREQLVAALRAARLHLRPEIGGRFDQKAAVAVIDEALSLAGEPRD